MALYIIEGERGDGKSVLMTYFLFRDMERGKQIWCNFTPSFKHKPLHMSEVMNNPDAVENASIGIDEAYLWFDSRKFGSKSNMLMSYLMMQSRKRKLDIYMAMPQKSLIDIRMRANVDYVLKCYAVIGSKTSYRRATIEELEDMQVNFIFVYKYSKRAERLEGFLFDPSPWFAMYDTNEFIDITA